MDHLPVSRRRRHLLKTVGAAAALGSLGFPAIVRSQADTVRIGHLTPRTGFLGPLGEYAVIGVNLAVEEINAACSNAAAWCMKDRRRHCATISNCDAAFYGCDNE
jgi:hypothetical protein